MTLTPIDVKVSTTSGLQISADGEDWKTKYEENDKEWRKKYQDRFFNGTPDDDKKDDILGPSKLKEDEEEDEDEENNLRALSKTLLQRPRFPPAPECR